MTTPRNHSVQKAFGILKAFDGGSRWMSGAELSRRANLPETTGNRFIQTLLEIGAVVRGPGGRYKPGMLMVSLSRKVAISELLRNASIKIMADLAHSLDVTLHLGILHDGMVHYVARESTPRSFLTQAYSGCQLEAYCTGLGKVLLGSLPEDQLEQVLFFDKLVPLTKHTIVDRRLLLRHLQEVRDLGFALDDREMREDLRCVAVPICNGKGGTIAALSAAESAEQMTPLRRRQLLYGLDKASAEIRRKIYPWESPAVIDRGPNPTVDVLPTPENPPVKNVTGSLPVPFHVI